MYNRQIIAAIIMLYKHRRIYKTGSTYIEIEEEINRVVPVIRGKKITDIPISVDTWKSEVASRNWCRSGYYKRYNGVFGRDKNMAKVVSNSKAEAILMFILLLQDLNMKVQKYFLNLGHKGLWQKRIWRINCYRLKRQCLSILKKV